MKKPERMPKAPELNFDEEVGPHLHGIFIFCFVISFSLPLFLNVVVVCCGLLFL